ncbi:MAG: hypothetical protein KJ622_03935 [Alphaproteobacteria bacterium]|nr:hypothetical protein [Alphaproteobacteria bacterium]
MSDITDFRISELEKRMNNAEDLIADLPHTMNLRLETIVGAQHETAARLGLMDKQLSMLVRDVRDMRGGVTRQLAEQDKRLSQLEQRLDGVETRLDGVETRLGAVERRLAGIDDKLQQLLDRS